MRAITEVTSRLCRNASPGQFMVPAIDHVKE